MKDKPIITLTKEEQDKLVLQYQQGNIKESKKAWLLIYKLFHPLISAVSKKYISGEESDKKLILSGERGLLKALESYDTNKKFKFSAYSTWFIKKEIIKIKIKDVL